MKVLVLGGSGMAGHVITLYLRENGFSVDTLAARHPLDDKTRLVDITDKSKLVEQLETGEYDIVINCVAALVRQSETQKDTAIYLNAYLPRFLERYYAGSQTKVIHISTDDVFSYDGPPPREDSPYTGRSFYGRTKALGEIINDKDLTFRMSIVGPDIKAEASGLFSWFYQQTGTISGFTKAHWNGITTLELARAIKAAIEQDLTGLYHLVPPQSISKYDLLVLFKDTFGRDDIQIKSADGNAVDKTLVNTRQDFQYSVPDYPTMVKDMKTWVNGHSGLYKHYGS